MEKGKKKWRRGRKIRKLGSPLTPFAIMYFQLFVGDPTLSG